MKEDVFPLSTRTEGRFDPETPTQAELDIMKEKARGLGASWGEVG